jgi:hypothetical protein
MADGQYEDISSLYFYTAPMVMGLLQFLTEISFRKSSWRVKARQARKADKFTANCEPIAYKI